MGESLARNYFDVFGVKASVGQVFTKKDERNPVVVLSDASW
jgi:hypothetical protein